MTRKEQLETLATILQMAAEKASGIAPDGENKTSREAALAVQLQGISMEYRSIAATLPAEQPPSGHAKVGAPERKSV